MKRFISLFLVLAIVFSLIAGMNICSSAATFSARLSAPAKSGWYAGYSRNNCVAYARCRANEILGYSVNWASGNGGKGFWNTSGFQHGTTPKLGAVACWSGHCAIVESISGSNIVLSEGHYSFQPKSNSTSYKNVVINGGGGSAGTWFDNYYGTILSSGKPSECTNETWYGYVYLEPYFNATNLLVNDYNRIHVQFNFVNTNGTKITTFYTQIRKKGETKWSSYKKNQTWTSGFTKKSTIGKNEGCKYTISDSMTYEIRGAAVSSSKTYYSYITTVTTPARINIQNTSGSCSNVKFTGSNISLSNNIKLYYGGKQLKKGTDYTLSKNTVKAIGKHTITITGINKYKGTRKVTITVYPKTPTLKSLSYSSITGRINLKWARVADCTKQQAAISTSSSFTKSTTGVGTWSGSNQSGSIYNYTVNGKKLHVQKGKTYYIKMRAYKVVNGEKIYGQWGAAKKITCR